MQNYVFLMLLKTWHILSRTNETRHTEWHETWNYKCGVDEIVCIEKQGLNNDKCKCECKDLIDKGRCDKGFIWIPSNCEFECDKSCDIGKYSNYKSCRCRKKLVDKLVKECGGYWWKWNDLWWDFKWL